MNRSIQTKLLVLAMALVLAFGITSPAAAQGIVYGNSIPAGTVVDQDVLLVGQKVVVDGTVNGNVFVLANQVTVNGTVGGSLVLIGQDASIAGTVSGGIYAAALTFDLAAHAVLERDLYVATVDLTSGDGSAIGRDLYAISLGSDLSGHVGRRLHTVIGPIPLYNGLMHLLGFDELTIPLHSQPAQETSPSSLIRGGRGYLRPVERPAAAGFDWGEWGLGLLRNWAVLFVLGLLVVWLARRPLERSGAQLQLKPVRATATGLLVLVLALGLVGVVLLVVLLFFALGLGLNALGLWQLSLGIWALVYSFLVMLLALLWFGIVYGTKIVVAFLVATWLFAKFSNTKAFWLDVLALLTGTLVYTLLRSIPYAGWVIGVLVTAAGAGAAWLAYREARRKPELVVVESSAIVEPATKPAGRRVKAASPGRKL